MNDRYILKEKLLSVHLF